MGLTNTAYIVVSYLQLHFRFSEHHWWWFGGPMRTWCNPPTSPDGRGLMAETSHPKRIGFVTEIISTLRVFLYLIYIWIRGTSCRGFLPEFLPMAHDASMYEWYICRNIYHKKWNQICFNWFQSTTHRIHGTGIFTYINGWFVWDQCR